MAYCYENPELNKTVINQSFKGAILNCNCRQKKSKKRTSTKSIKNACSDVSQFKWPVP